MSEAEEMANHAELRRLAEAATKPSEFGLYAKSYSAFINVIEPAIILTLLDQIEALKSQLATARNEGWAAAFECVQHEAAATQDYPDSERPTAFALQSLLAKLAKQHPDAWNFRREWEQDARNDALEEAAKVGRKAVMSFKGKVGGKYYAGYHEDMREYVAAAVRKMKEG